MKRIAPRFFGEQLLSPEPSQKCYEARPVMTCLPVPEGKFCRGLALGREIVPVRFASHFGEPIGVTSAPDCNAAGNFPLRRRGPFKLAVILKKINFPPCHALPEGIAAALDSRVNCARHGVFIELILK